MTPIETAVAPHLQRERTCPFRHPAGFDPSYPTKVARFSPDITEVVMPVAMASFSSVADTAIARRSAARRSPCGARASGHGPEMVK